jgi:hypothetical protein
MKQVESSNDLLHMFGKKELKMLFESNLIVVSFIISLHIDSIVKNDKKT